MKAIIFVLVIFKLTTTNAQSFIPYMKEEEGGSTLEKTFMRYEQKWKLYDEFMSKCARGVAYVKFNLDRKGRVSNVKINREAPGYLKSFLVDAIKETSRHWTISKQHIYYSLILPVYFYFDGCSGILYAYPEKDIPDFGENHLKPAIILASIKLGRWVEY